jgi:hypothetical protein
MAGNSDAAPDGGLGLARPAILLRGEGAVLFVLAVALYTRLDASWLLFAVLALAPDLSALGYLAGPRIGAMSYNLAHWAAVPGVLALVGLAADDDTTLAIALIWFAHIAIDRALGYGLKYPTSFRATHLQRV